MEKGKFGVVLAFYAVLAFVLAFLGQTLLCGLLLLFVIGAEKNEWVSKQVMQAFFLLLLSSVISSVFGAFSSVFSAIPILGSIIATIIRVVEGIISLALLVFEVLGIVNVCKGKDANVPVFSDLAGKAFGLVKKTVYSNPNPNNTTQ